MWRDRLGSRARVASGSDFAAVPSSGVRPPSNTGLRLTPGRRSALASQHPHNLGVLVGAARGWERRDPLLAGKLAELLDKRAHLVSVRVRLGDRWRRLAVDENSRVVACVADGRAARGSGYGAGVATTPCTPYESPILCISATSASTRAVSATQSRTSCHRRAQAVEATRYASERCAHLHCRRWHRSSALLEGLVCIVRRVGARGNHVPVELRCPARDVVGAGNP